MTEQRNITLPSTRALETLSHEELLQTTRRLLAEADALSSRISALNEIGLAVNDSLDLERIERVIAKQAKWLLDFEHCSVCLQEDSFEDERFWVIKTLFGAPEPTHVDPATMPNLKSVMFTTRPLIVRQPIESAFLGRYASQILIPLSADGVFLGTIHFATSAPDRYTQDDMRIGYMLSLQLASAIRNAQIVAELRETRAELRLRVEELDAFAHTIAHDLKSPLNNVMMRAQLLSMIHAELLPEDALALLAGIEDSTLLMGRMIDQLLMLAKLRRLDAHVVDADSAVAAALRRFDHAIAQKGIRVVTPPALPSAMGHDQWVEEVFANLISNAIKYIGEKPNPTITIAGALDTSAQPPVVRYEVRDTGIGIKPEARGSLFEMFTRVHDQVGIEGLGLGLSIVRRIIHKLHGQVGVESVYGEGTTFWFTLPAVDPLKMTPPTAPDIATAPDAPASENTIAASDAPAPDATASDTAAPPPSHEVPPQS